MTDRDRLIELFKKTEYTPFPEMIMTANLGNQFTEYGLNCIVDYLLANGVIVPPCKVGDTVYAIFNGKVLNGNVFSMKIETEDNKYIFMLKLKIFDHIFQFKTFLFGKTVFLTKEEAEKHLKEREGK